MIIEDLSTMRQRDLMRELNFVLPGGVKVMRKILPNAPSKERLEAMILRLSDPSALKVARHLPRIPADVLDVLLSSWLFAAATPKLLLEASEREESAEPIHILLETAVELARLLGEPPPRFVSIADLWDYAVPDLFLMDEVADLMSYVLPSAPLPGLRGVIEPLDTPQAICVQARLLRHCIFAPPCLEELRSGYFALYRTVGQWGLEPCTIELERVEGTDGADLWLLHEIKAAANRTVKRATLRVVVQWLCDVQQITDPQPVLSRIKKDAESEEEVTLFDLDKDDLDAKKPVLSS